MSGIVGGAGAVSGILGETTVPTVAGVVKEVQWDEQTSDSGDRTISPSAFYGFGTIYNMQLPAGETILVEASGGMCEFDAGVNWGMCVNTSNNGAHGSTTAGTFHNNTGTNSSAMEKQPFGPVSAIVVNNTTAQIHLFYRLGMKGWDGDVTARWFGDASIDLAQFIKATRYVT